MVRKNEVVTGPVGSGELSEAKLLLVWGIVSFLLPVSYYILL
jgi:hypothetical protein